MVTNDWVAVSRHHPDHAEISAIWCCLQEGSEFSVDIPAASSPFYFSREEDAVIYTLMYNHSEFTKTEQGEMISKLVCYSRIVYADFYSRVHFCVNRIIQ